MAAAVLKTSLKRRWRTAGRSGIAAAHAAVQPRAAKLDDAFIHPVAWPYGIEVFGGHGYREQLQPDQRCAPRRAMRRLRPRCRLALSNCHVLLTCVREDLRF
jgi:hypothetical protein